MRLSACVVGTVLATAGFVAAAAEAPLRLDPGNWRVRVTSVTNGAADPDQDTEVCLSDELKDLAAYFSPELEGVKARCTTTRVPSKDPKVIARRLRCTATGFTYEAESSVTIANPSRFVLSMRSRAKTPTQTGIVSAAGQGDRLGPCKSP
jgi:hypothetical protein